MKRLGIKGIDDLPRPLWTHYSTNTLTPYMGRFGVHYESFTDRGDEVRTRGLNHLTGRGTSKGMLSSRVSHQESGRRRCSGP